MKYDPQKHHRQSIRNQQSFNTLRQYIANPCPGNSTNCTLTLLLEARGKEKKSIA